MTHVTLNPLCWKKLIFKSINYYFVISPIVCLLLFAVNTPSNAQTCSELNRIVAASRNVVPRDSLVILARQAVKGCAIQSNQFNKIVSLYNISQIYAEIPSLGAEAVSFSGEAIQIYYAARFQDEVLLARLYELRGVAFSAQRVQDSSLLNFAKARALMENVMDSNRNASQATGEAYMSLLNQIATSYLEMERYYDAETTSLSLLAFIDQSSLYNSRQYGYALNNYGSSLMKQGEYRNSVPVFQKWIELYTLSRTKSASDSILYTKMLNNLANSYLQLGAFSLAIPLFEESHNIRTFLFKDTDQEFVLSLDNLAAVYFEIGRYHDAIDASKKVLQLARSFGTTHPIYLNALNTMSQAQVNLDMYRPALANAKKRYRLHKSILAQDKENLSIAMLNLGSVYKSVGRPRLAQRWTRRASSTYHAAKAQNANILTILLNNEAANAADLGDPEKSIRIYRESMQILDSNYRDDIPTRLTVLNNIATQYERLGLNDSAMSTIKRASILVHRQVLNKIGVLSDDEKLSYVSSIDEMFNIYKSYYYRCDEALKVKYSSLIYENELLLKSFVLSANQQLRTIMESSTDSVLVSMYREWKFMRTRQVKLGTRSINVDDSRDASRAISELERRMSVRSLTFSNWLSQFNVNYQQVKSSLKPNEFVIEFVVNREFSSLTKATQTFRYSAIVLSKNSPDLTIIPLFAESELDHILENVYKTTRVKEQINGIYGTQSLDDSNCNRELFKLIWDPIIPFLKDAKMVYVVPVKKLNNLSLQALHSATFSPIDTFSIIQLQTSRSLVTKTPDDLSINDFSDHPLSAVLIGGVNYNLDDGTPLPPRSEKSTYFFPLPYTRIEVSSIDSLLRSAGLDVRRFEDGNGSEELVKSLSNMSPSILHLATHGFFNPKSNIETQTNRIDSVFAFSKDPLLRSGLVLARANAALTGHLHSEETSEDGILTAAEVSLLDLTRTKLLILSACETASGDINNSEGILGLQRAFKIAGVSNMIVSLWKISDKVTAVFMNSFYKRFCSGVPLELAFTLTQREMKALYDPYYWGPFVLIR